MIRMLMIIMSMKLVDQGDHQVDFDVDHGDHDDNHPWKKHARKKQTKDRSVDRPRDQASYFQHAREEPGGHILALCKLKFFSEKFTCAVLEHLEI